MFISHLRRLLADTGGNFAITTLLMLVPLIGVVGLAIDVSQMVTGKEMLQYDVDATAMMAASEMDDGNISAAIGVATTSLQARDAESDAYQLDKVDFAAIDSNGLSIDASASVEPIFVQLLGVDRVSFTAHSIVSTSDEHYELSVVIDKTSSMLLAASEADQQRMSEAVIVQNGTEGSTNCAFACHSPDFTVTYRGATYDTLYQFARAQKIRLRLDVEFQALNVLLDAIDRVDPRHRLIKLNIYTFGANADAYSLYYDAHGMANDGYSPADSIRKVIGPTADTAMIRTALATNPELSSASSYDTSDFRALKTLASSIGPSGDGRSSSSPKKAVLFLTDGVQSSQSWLFGGLQWISPLNPAWCDPVKNQGARLAVVYTRYVPARGDIFFDNSLGLPLSYSNYSEYWGAALPSPPNITGIDYLPSALAACATNPELFLSASAPDEIEKGLLTLVERAMDNSALRLTQ